MYCFTLHVIQLDSYEYIWEGQLYFELGCPLDNHDTQNCESRVSKRSRQVSSEKKKKTHDYLLKFLAEVQRSTSDWMPLSKECRAIACNHPMDN